MAGINLERGEGQTMRKDLQVTKTRDHKWDADVHRRGFGFAVKRMRKT